VRSGNAPASKTDWGIVLDVQVGHGPLWLDGIAQALQDYFQDLRHGSG
jgi:hypothetical protein